MKGTIIFDLEGTLVDVGGSSVSKVLIKENLLAQLALDYEICIVTGATREQLSYVLGHTFLGKYFSARKTVARDDCPESKATGRPFQKLLESGVPEPIVIIGDSEGDKLGAEALAIPFVHVVTADLLSGDTFDEYVKSALCALS